MTIPPPPAWVLDSELPVEWRADAEAQLLGVAEPVDVDDQWRRYVANRLTPPRPGERGPPPISAADWRGWVLRAPGHASRERRQRESQARPSGGGRRGDRQPLGDPAKLPWLREWRDWDPDEPEQPADAPPSAETGARTRSGAQGATGRPRDEKAPPRGSQGPLRPVSELTHQTRKASGGDP